MGLVAEDHLVTPAAVDQLANEVGHGAADHQQCRRLAAALGGHVLQAPYCGVFPVNVIADLGLGYSLSHALGGRSDGIAAQIDGKHGKIPGWGLKKRTKKTKGAQTVEFQFSVKTVRASIFS
jgi:hypothetical protein